MAEEHNALKYGPSISKAASTAAGGGYGDVGVSRLSETLTPTMNLWQRPEWELLRGEILFARSVLVSAVAARNSSAELINPTGSQKLVVLRLIEVILATGLVEFSIDSGAALAANPVTARGVALDGRFPQLGETSIATLVTGDLAAGATNVQWRTREAGKLGTAPLPWVLSPGRKLFAVTFGVLESFQANFYWSERSPFPGELQARG